MNLCNCDAKVPASQCGYSKELSAPGSGIQLAIATIPMQPWETPHESSRTLKQGTVFPYLDPLFFIAEDEKNT